MPAISFVVIMLAANLSASGDDPPQLAVYSMDLDGSNLKKVAQATERKWHAAPIWSNDGQFILFHAHVNDAETQDSH
ncbi:hypothetical protein AB0181_28165, partial [Klebsiella pneumoniae]